MSSPRPPMGPAAATDDEVRGWTSRAGTDTEYEPVTESESKVRGTLANSISRIAASIVEEGSECTHGDPSSEHESIGLAKAKSEEEKTPLKFAKTKITSPSVQTGAGMREFLLSPTPQPPTPPASACTVREGKEEEEPKGKKEKKTRKSATPKTPIPTSTSRSD